VPEERARGGGGGRPEVWFGDVAAVAVEARASVGRRHKRLARSHGAASRQRTRRGSDEGATSDVTEEGRRAEERRRAASRPGRCRARWRVGVRTGAALRWRKAEGRAAPARGSGMRDAEAEKEAVRGRRTSAKAAHGVRGGRRGGGVSRARAEEAKEGHTRGGASRLGRRGRRMQG
jgi:hypothetical protein